MDIDPKRTHWIANFGRNLRFRPKLVIQPRTVDELLTVMNQVKGRRIRVVGRRHGWSRGIESENVLIDLTNFDSVETTQRGNEKWAVIGAGCQIKHALSELDRQAGWTLPAVGLITEQSIAGACSTATHGSGRHSLSHYLEEVQIACYDRQSGKAVIRIVSAGPELQAARCSLGCLGIIVAVGLKCVSQYEVEDHFQSFPTLEASRHDIAQCFNIIRHGAVIASALEIVTLFAFWRPLC